MHVSPTELEHIVRVVMARLAVGRDLMAGVAEMADAANDPGELAISERIVTIQLVEGRLDGKCTLRVEPHAVITPATKDLLRAKNVEIVRGTRSVLKQSSNALASKSADEARTSDNIPTLVCGSAVWFNSLARHLCPKQAVVEACDDARALTLAERHLARGGKRAVWLTTTPFAAAVSARRSPQLSTVQLPSLSELAAAQEQAHPQIWIVDAPRWTVAAIGNLVRTLARTE